MDEKSTSWAAVQRRRAARGMGIGFHLAGIHNNYAIVPTISFNRKRMTALFRYTEELAADGYPWLRVPHGLNWRERLPLSPGDDGTPAE